MAARKKRVRRYLGVEGEQGEWKKLTVFGAGYVYIHEINYIEKS